MQKSKTSNANKKKLKVLEDIQATNIKTEEEFLAMTAKDFFTTFPDISMEDFKIMYELQNSIKNKTLFTYLCND